MAGIFQRFLRREPIAVLKIELNGNRLTLDRLSKENNIIHDTLREVSYMAPDSIPMRASRMAQDAGRAPEAHAELAESIQGQPALPGEELARDAVAEAQQQATAARDRLQQLRLQEKQQPAANAKGLKGKLAARRARQQAEQEDAEQEAWRLPGSTIMELRSNIKINKGQIMKVQLLDAAKGCSVALRRCADNEFLEWAGDPYLYGSVFSSGILQTVLQRKARLGTLVLVFIIAFILGGITLGGLV